MKNLEKKENRVVVVTRGRVDTNNMKQILEKIDEREEEVKYLNKREHELVVRKSKELLRKY